MCCSAVVVGKSTVCSVMHFSPSVTMSTVGLFIHAFCAALSIP